MSSSGPTVQNRNGQEKPVIESIAIFADPIGHLNKLGIKVPGQFSISVKRKSPNARMWHAYWYESGRPFLTARGEELASEMFETLRSEVESYFSTKAYDWVNFSEKTK